MSDLKAMRTAAQLFCQQNVRECCQELIEWQNTAILRDGKVRELAKLCEKYVGNHEGLRNAERMVERMACELVGGSHGS